MCTKTVFTILDSSQNEVRSRDSKLPSAEVIRESMWPTPSPETSAARDGTVSTGDSGYSQGAITRSQGHPVMP